MNLGKIKKKEKENPFESMAEIVFYQRTLLENLSAKTGCLGHGPIDSFTANPLTPAMGILHSTLQVIESNEVTAA